jgi:hypothetical protein
LSILVPALETGNDIAQFSAVRIELTMAIKPGFIADRRVRGGLALTRLLEQIALAILADDLQVLVPPADIDDFEIALDDGRRVHKIALHQIRDDSVDR